MQRSETLIRDIYDGSFEESAEGILMPKSRVLARGEYRHSVNGQDERVDQNLVVTEFLTYLLATGVGAPTAPVDITTWYVSLYSAAYTPLATLTAASYPATAGEITSGTEGYTEAVRQTWTEIAVVAGQTDNYAARATFTIATASTLSVNGAAVSSVNTKGATTGTLMSAVKFTATRSLFNTDSFQVGYRITLVGV